jgi:hypothetical protein
MWPRFLVDYSDPGLFFLVLKICRAAPFAEATFTNAKVSQKSHQ